MPPFLWCGVLYKAILPFYFHDRLLSGPASRWCSCDFACFIIWNWNFNCKVTADLLSNWYFLWGRDGMMILTNMTGLLNGCLVWRRLSNEAWIDLVPDVGHPRMNPSIPDTVIFSMERHLHCTRRTSRKMSWSASCTPVWFCGGRSFALWMSSTLFMRTVCTTCCCFLPGCVMPMQHLLGNWHLNCYFINHPE